jgi:hypothetical protein
VEKLFFRTTLTPRTSAKGETKVEKNGKRKKLKVAQASLYFFSVGFRFVSYYQENNRRNTHARTANFTYYATSGP